MLGHLERPMLRKSIRKLSWIHCYSFYQLVFWIVFPIVAAAGVSQGDGHYFDMPQENVLVVDLDSKTSPPSSYQLLLLEVDIDGQKLNQTVQVLMDQGGIFYIQGEDLSRWRFRAPPVSKAIQYEGLDFYPLTAIEDISHLFNAEKMTLAIEVRPEAFVETQRLSQSSIYPPSVRSGSGGFINYDLLGAQSENSSQRFGQFEFGYFNTLGVGTMSLLAEHSNTDRRATRLESTWTIDHPETMHSLRLGDAVSSPGSWGRAVRFGGAHYGTNFGTQPGFLTYVPQSAVGQAVLPSTVDVFVNNALVSRQTVPPGPFEIRNLPIVSGAGIVQLVVKDLLGRSQIITLPFYGSQALLRKGLDDFSLDIGVVRDNFGIESNDYGTLIGSGNFRRGFSDSLTGELHLEATQGQATAGAGGDFLLGQLGTASVFVALSHSSSGQGGLLMVSFDRQSESWGMGARTQFNTRAFTQIGLQSPQLMPASLCSAYISHAMGQTGSLGFAIIRQINRDQASTNIATLSYNVTFGQYGTLSLAVVRDFSSIGGNTIFATFNSTLGPSMNASLSLQSTKNSDGTSNEISTAVLERNLPAGEGYGYLLQTRSDQSSEASYVLQNNVGTYSLDAAQNQGATATRLSVSGGVAILGGDAFLSRRIDQSFAVATVPDYPNVRLLKDNQPAGRTNSEGKALLPNLRAYDRNVIALDQGDLPLDATIRSIKVEAVPYFRSGIVVIFPVEHSRGALFVIHLEDGTPLPVGALIRKEDSDEHFIVGYGGEVYVIGLGPLNKMHAVWGKQSCEFILPYQAGEDPLPDLGIFTCKRVEP
jgi:outer membrane usher protein